MTEEKMNQSGIISWVIIFLLVTVILFQGFFAFIMIGDRGQPTWDYRPVKDVPGQSPYAVYQLLPYPQHIRGAKGE